MKPVFLVLFALLFIGSLDLLPIVQADGIDWGRVDPLCTISCAGYWLCVVKGKASDCKRPANCICEEFPH